MSTSDPTGSGVVGARVAGCKTVSRYRRIYHAHLGRKIDPRNGEIDHFDWGFPTGEEIDPGARSNNCVLWPILRKASC